MKLWAMPCRDTQDRGHGGEFWQNMVHCGREWQTTSVFLPWESHEQHEKAKRYDTERWTPQVGRCPIVTREEWGNSSTMNEEEEPKEKQCLAVDMTGDGGKVGCCKEQYCIGSWKVRWMNQGKLEVVKQKMARVNEHWHFRISELKWTGIGKFNSDDHYIYYCGQEYLRRNGVALTLKKNSEMKYLGAISKMTEWSRFVSKAKHSISQ